MSRDLLEGDGFCAMYRPSDRHEQHPCSDDGPSSAGLPPSLGDVPGGDLGTSGLLGPASAGLAQVQERRADHQCSTSEQPTQHPVGVQVEFLLPGCGSGVGRIPSGDQGAHSSRPCYAPDPACPESLVVPQECIELLEDYEAGSEAVVSRSDQYLDPVVDTSPLTFEVYACLACDTLTTTLSHARHGHQLVPEEVFQAVFGSMRFERRGTKESSKVFFYTKRLETIRKRMEDLGPLLGAGYGVVPYGEWEVKFSELPSPYHYRNMIQVAIKMFNHPSSPRNETSKKDQNKSMPAQASCAILCKKTRRLGTWLDCNCPSHHVRVSKNLWACVFDYLNWVATVDRGVVTQLFLVDKDSEMPLVQVPMPSEIAQFRGYGTMPIGDWSISVDQIPGWSLIHFRAARHLFDARALISMIEALEEEASASSFYTCRSRLDDFLDESAHAATPQRAIMGATEEDLEVEAINYGPRRSVGRATTRRMTVEGIVFLEDQREPQPSGSQNPGAVLINQDVERPARVSAPRAQHLFDDTGRQEEVRSGCHKIIVPFRSWEDRTPPKQGPYRTQSLKESQAITTEVLDLSAPLERRATESPSGRPLTSTPLGRRSIRFYNLGNTSQSSVVISDRPGATAHDQSASDAMEADEAESRC